MPSSNDQQSRTLIAALTCAAMVIVALVCFMVLQPHAPSGDDAPATEVLVDTAATTTSASVSDATTPTTTSEPGTGADTAETVVTGDGGDDGDGAYEAGVVLVSVPEGATAQQINDAIAASPLLADQQVSEQDVAEGLLTLTLKPDVTVEQATEELAQEDEVFSETQPNFIYYPMEQGDATTLMALTDPIPETTEEEPELLAQAAQWLPNDAELSEQWALASMHLYEAWALQRTEGDVTVALIDTGTFCNHEDLKANVVGQYNSVKKTNDASDVSPVGHGTHVAGIVGAVANNGLDVAGTSYNAKILPICAAKSSGGKLTFSTDSIDEAYRYITEKADALNIRVVNMSLGGVRTSNTDTRLLNIINEAEKAGILTVAAAGNSNTASVPFAEYPGDWPAVLSVMNLQQGLTSDTVELSYTSNYNTPGTTKSSEYTKDVCAPGTSIVSTSTSNSSPTVWMDGTSMASPAVAGVAALCFAANPSLTPAQVRSIICDSATDLGAKGWDVRYGSGEVNALEAVRAAGGTSEKTTVTRLWGSIALDTMKAIVAKGWSSDCGGTVVLATNDGYWDALSASGIAGLADDAPVLLTNGTSLSPQAEEQLNRIKPTKIIVCGGTAAITNKVMDEAAEAADTSIGNVTRLAGDTATGTAAAIARKASSTTGGTWSDTAFIATNDGYWDALSVGPAAYALNMPIFLTEGAKSISSETIAAMQAAGITKFYLVGGTAAVSDSVKTQLTSAKFKFVQRLAGDNAVKTSIAVANWEMSQDMEPNGLAIATNDGYWDALTGAALCGKNDAPLLLVSDTDRSALDFAARNKSKVTLAYVFGGKAAVSDSSLNALKAKLGI